MFQNKIPDFFRLPTEVGTVLTTREYWVALCFGGHIENESKQIVATYKKGIRKTIWKSSEHNYYWLNDDNKSGRLFDENDIAVATSNYIKMKGKRINQHGRGNYDYWIDWCYIEISDNSYWFSWCVPHRNGIVNGQQSLYISNGENRILKFDQYRNKLYILDKAADIEYLIFVMLSYGLKHFD